MTDIFTLCLAKIATLCIRTYADSSDTASHDSQGSKFSSPSALRSAEDFGAACNAVVAATASAEATAGAEATTGPSSSEIRSRVLKIAAEILELDIEDLSMDAKLTDVGGDSLMAMELRTTMDDEFEVNLDIARRGQTPVSFAGAARGALQGTCCQH